jgi:hypothetical protein
MLCWLRDAAAITVRGLAAHLPWGGLVVSMYYLEWIGYNVNALWCPFGHLSMNLCLHEHFLKIARRA